MILIVDWRRRIEEFRLCPCADIRSRHERLDVLEAMHSFRGPLAAFFTSHCLRALSTPVDSRCKFRLNSCAGAYVTETSTAMKFLGGFGVLAAVVGPTFLVSQYVSELRNDVTSSKAEVERLKGQVDQLQVLLERTQTLISSGSRGPKGDKGEPGDIGPQGPRGERGMQGERGAAGESTSGGSDLADVLRRLNALENRTQAAVQSSSLPALNAKAPSECVVVPQTQRSGTFQAFDGMRICGEGGEFLARASFERKDRVMFVNQGRRHTCTMANPCDFLETNAATFVLDSIDTTVEGIKVASFSSYPR